MFVWPGPLDAAVTFGRYLMKSSKLETFSSARLSPVKACMAIGTSCEFSERRCAVTVTSWMPPADTDWSMGSAAYAAAPACALRMAETARAHFGFSFIRGHPVLVNMDGPAVR